MKNTFEFLMVQEGGGGGLSDMSGNSGYPRLGDTAAAVLQKAYELSSSSTEMLL
jgi:hypothetical protein